MHLKRSNVTIVSSNAPQALKRYYSKLKCTSSAQTSSVSPSDRSQIGLESSETKKCSQRFEIDHFCKGNNSVISSAEFPS